MVDSVWKQDTNRAQVCRMLVTRGEWVFDSSVCSVMRKECALPPWKKIPSFCDQRVALLIIN